MKYLAILKDSFREAIDTKIIYFTFGLAVLFLLGVASLSFRQVPAEEQFRRSTELLSRLLAWATQGKGPRYDIEDFTSSDPAADPWRQDYRFYYVLEFQEEKDADTFKAEMEKNKSLGPEELQKQLKRQFHWIDRLEVTDAPPKSKKDIRFLVQTKGTTVPDRRSWTYEPQLFFGAWSMSFFQSPLYSQLEFITDTLIGGFGAGVIMLLSTIITAFFIPNMLRKGTVDLLLAKPIHRTTLLLFKYIGGLTFMFLNTAFIMLGIWLVLGLRTGLWMNGLLTCVLVFTFQFAIFYAVSTLMAVLTRSPIVAILATVVAWAILVGIGIGYRVIDSFRPERIADLPKEQQEVVPRAPGWLLNTADVIHFLTPHYKDLDALTTKLIRSDLTEPDSVQRKEIEKQIGTINWGESLSVTIGYIAILVGASCWWFATRDY
jgi:ABC-type transport system involved in multi-copper enzyme maturation permease subunit